MEGFIERARTVLFSGCARAVNSSRSRGTKWASRSWHPPRSPKGRCSFVELGTCSRSGLDDDRHDLGVDGIHIHRRGDGDELSPGEAVRRSDGQKTGIEVDAVLQIRVGLNRDGEAVRRETGLVE